MESNDWKTYDPLFTQLSFFLGDENVPTAYCVGDTGTYLTSMTQWHRYVCDSHRIVLYDTGSPVAGRAEPRNRRKARLLQALQTNSGFTDEVRLGQLEVREGLPRVWWEKVLSQKNQKEKWDKSFENSWVNAGHHGWPQRSISSWENAFCAANGVSLAGQAQGFEICP